MITDSKRPRLWYGTTLQVQHELEATTYRFFLGRRFVRACLQVNTGFACLSRSSRIGSFGYIGQWCVLYLLYLTLLTPPQFVCQKTHTRPPVFGLPGLATESLVAESRTSLALWTIHPPTLFDFLISSNTHRNQRFIPTSRTNGSSHNRKSAYDIISDPKPLLVISLDRRLTGNFNAPNFSLEKTEVWRLPLWDLLVVMYYGCTGGTELHFEGGGTDRDSYLLVRGSWRRWIKPDERKSQ